MTADSSTQTEGYYLCLFSIHGLIRGENLELGRDSDTGGQTRYVVELARALARHPEVARVDLLTRRVVDAEVDASYAQRVEPLGDGASIVRLDAGPDGYVFKEELWDYLDAFVDNTIDYLNEQPRRPDLLHSHYADAGYVAARLSHLLGLPMIHTGHSLGRVKRRRLLANGLDGDQIEERYRMTRRIHAEEVTLASAERVITSTRQEIEEQYGLYDFYQPERMEVIPPGTDLTSFRPPDGSEPDSAVASSIGRFLRDPDKPMVLVLARPDPRKNLPAHVEAFAADPTLAERANLVVVAGSRDDVQELEGDTRDLLTELILTIDRHDLYGSVAYPKAVPGDEIPVLYRLAAASGGVHVNAALTEPFGLTLIESAASGLPIVATADGGPRDIIANCDCGVLVDPLETDDIARGIHEVLDDRARWQERSRNGLEGVRQHYSWTAHAKRYVEMARGIIGRHPAPAPHPEAPQPNREQDRIVVSDIDQSLLGYLGRAGRSRDGEARRREAREAVAELAAALRANRRTAAFGIATGRRLDSALRVLRASDLPEPDILITSGGTRIHYAPSLTEDHVWTRHIDRQWTPHVVRRVLADLPGIERQPRGNQSRFKLSYYIDPSVAPSLEEINALLFREDQSVNVIMSFGQFLDVLPIRASKGLALRFAATRLGIPTERVLVAGGSGADEDMMRGNTLAVVVANRHHEELSQLDTGSRDIYFAERPYAAGIIEAIEHYDFFGACRPPAEREGGEVP